MLPERRGQCDASSFSTDLYCACFGAKSWVHCLKQMPVFDFDLFIPLNPHSLEVSTGPVLGVENVCVCVCSRARQSLCVCVCMCCDDVSFTA